MQQTRPCPAVPMAPGAPPLDRPDPCTLPTRAAFWAQYLTTMRPYLLPISGLAGLAGLSLAGVGIDWRWGVALVVFTLSYGLGQALTDCFQIDTDRLSAPYRPLVRGGLSPRHVVPLSGAGLALGAAALAWINPWTLVVSAGAVGGLLVYTPLKRRWWAGPMMNAWVVALLPITGWLVHPQHDLVGLLGRLDVWAVAFTGFAAYANFVLVGYLKDVGADRATGYNTFPVRFGWRRTAWVSHARAVLALGAGAWAVWLLSSDPSAYRFVPWGVVGAAGVVSLIAQVSLHPVRTERDAHGPIVHVVRVFLLLNAAIVLAARPEWWAVAVAYLAAFEVLIRLRPERSQV